ncbi:MAG TPA: 3-hydroxyacyl-CoA dehydrogenase NAD-binding domain-containing protein [Steroidobacteraceae bacterium]|nr:3-hydroxyacyl-CoA dehydrogenase NAD-binding domain-containing protein [Steroidobacteraceae bacterium]
MRQVKVLGLLGTGVIGGGWAARALHLGIDVVAMDTKPEMESWIRGAVENARAALSRLTLAPLPPEGKLTFTTDLEAMARQVDFIQENIPEQLELKQRVLAQASRAAPADVVIASSTSGLLPSDLQRDMQAPERLLVAHPFNPVYLLPLVELVGGRATSAATLDAAARFYTEIGMHPLRVRREVPGHLTDRLQEALWREILHLVNDGVATTGELDEAIVYGPGLRWAGMGTNLIYHLAGGETGMRHMLRQFGPCLKWPWTKLEAPELTETLIDRMVEGTQAQADGRSIRELERLRDEYLLAIQQVLKQFDLGAGATLRGLEARLYERSGRSAVDGLDAAAAATGGAGGPVRMLDTYVRPEWIDYNGHMTDSRYLQVFGDATDALFRWAGVDDAYRKAGRAMYTLESHVRHVAEAKALEPIYVTTQILELDAKRVRLHHSLHRRRDEAVIATARQVYVHVDTRVSHGAPFEPSVHERLDRLRAAHAALPR